MESGGRGCSEEGRGNERIGENGRGNVWKGGCIEVLDVGIVMGGVCHIDVCGF